MVVDNEGEVDGSAEGSDDQADDEGETEGKGRRYTKEEELEVDKFGMKVKALAEGLAVKYGRKPRDILIRAGLGMKYGRKENISNVYKTWYAMRHDKEPGCKLGLSIFWKCFLNVLSPGSRDEWLAIMTKEYNRFMAGLATDDREGRHLRMKPIIEEVKAMKAANGVPMKEPTTRLKGYVKQLEGLVCCNAQQLLLY
jgi:hypothetical protein